VPTNFRSLTAFLWKVRWLWLRSLRRRSPKDGTTCKRFDRVTAVRLPKPKILHPWPQDRFAVNHPRWKPGAVVPRAGFCAGRRGATRVPTAKGRRAIVVLTATVFQ
jgi:RNA-directed DNA polymerase